MLAAVLAFRLKMSSTKGLMAHAIISDELFYILEGELVDSTARDTAAAIGSCCGPAPSTNPIALPGVR
jgi:hypothetical protein